MCVCVSVCLCSVHVDIAESVMLLEMYGKMYGKGKQGKDGNGTLLQIAALTKGSSKS